MIIGDVFGCIIDVYDVVYDGVGVGCGVFDYIVDGVGGWIEECFDFWLDSYVDGVV